MGSSRSLKQGAAHLSFTEQSVARALQATAGNHLVGHQRTKLGHEACSREMCLAVVET